ncbi:hypothetical protein [Streptomyces sp. NPDC058240]|uniref:hypothetical protein n=1 Tax=Streptomyces sp. NPDC058240 TaxID=3346396 RepID=UPI0036EEE4B2
MISERVGEARFMVCSLLANVVVAVPMFLLINTARPVLVFCGIALEPVEASSGSVLREPRAASGVGQALASPCWSWFC